MNEELQGMENIRNPSPGGEGRVRGLFPGIVERPANKAKPAPGKRETRMDFGRSKYRNRRCVICPAIHPSRNPPTDSFEEADFE